MSIDRKFRSAVVWALGCTVAVAGATDISTVPLETYTATSSVDVKPNILYVLDDSGSMDWDYLPDEAGISTYYNNSAYRYNASFNGVAYNPAVVYKPPVHVNSSGVSDTTTYKNMTGVDTSTGGDSSATTSSPNWNRVKDDAYGVQATTTSNLTPSTTLAPRFFTTIAGEYCTTASLRVCTTASATSTSYPFPANLRWCNGTTCKAGYDSAAGYTTARMPTPRTATITISSSSSGSVSGITVDSKQIMSAASGASSTTSTVASNIAAQINACTYVLQGNCQIVGYKAAASSNVVTITAPGATTATPSITVGAGSISFTATAFTHADGIPGENLRTTITPSVNSYPYPGSSTKASSRTDCAGTTCTYQEEMTNYANWWTYYRTRMQMMKTAASNAMSTIDTATDIAAGKSRFRLGYMSINNNTGTDFVNLGEFTGAQKGTWYSKLTSANPGSSTPLRRALADAGRIYAGVLNGTTYNGVTVTDPLQYSCQKNFTLLSTDGFWNNGAGYKLDGATAVGNQDGGLPAPYGDGGTAQLQTRTSTLQTAAVTTTYSTSTSNLQSRTLTSQTAPSIQRQDSSDKGKTWGAWYNVSSCTPVTSGTNRTNCNYPRSDSTDGGTTWSNWYYQLNTACTASSPWWSQNWTACSGTVTVASSWSNVSSCTASSGVQCQYTAWSGWSQTSSCTPVAQSTSSPYTVGTAVQCKSALNPSSPTWTNASGPCTTTTTTACRYTTWTSWSNTSACTAVPQDAGPTYNVLTARQCQSTTTGGTSDTLADVAAYYYSTDLRSPTATAPDATGTCTGPIISPNTTPNDLCADNVPAFGRDTATFQHMTTFTLGLGAQGKMVYAPTDGRDYWNDTSGDFYDILKKNTANPSSGICSWLSSGTCYWPTPASNSNANIDDLWHAAVNGRGTYFSAKDANSLSSSLNNLLTTIAAVPRPGVAAAAASSNPNVSTSDNFVYSSSYQSVTWFGEMVRQTIDVTTGQLSAQNWSAMRLLDCATTSWTAGHAYVAGDVYQQGGFCYLVLGNYTSGTSFDGSTSGVDGVSTRKLLQDEASPTSSPVAAKNGRTLYTNSSTALIPFNWTNLQAVGLDTYFSQSYLTPLLSQFCASGVNCLSSADQANASGSTLVSFLSGDRTREGSYYRQRTHVLGDIVSSEGRYVKAPLFNYVDAGYSDFKTAMASRQGTVYVGSNDGMLHAFDGTTGQELWGYVPQPVIPNLYALADKNYFSTHQYFVDATPEVGDISVPCTPVFPATTCIPWRTILVGGLNRGGNSYYALDITDPNNPKYLWTFTDSKMGYSYGNPRITKLKDGTWVVILTSGYNNSDGQGYVFVVNAWTGALIRTISNNTGTTAAPASVARVSAHVPTSDTNNTVQAVYGGDLQGNLWRFDVNGDIGASGYDAQRLVSVQDPSGNPQPITAKPSVVTISGYPVVYFGAGKYLGVTDINNTQTESFYAAVDTLGSTALPTPRSTGSGFVKQTLTAGTCPSGAPVSICDPNQVVRTVTSNAVNIPTDKGWYLDFLTGGERVYTDPSIELGTLVFTTNVPSMNSASVCGDPSTAGAKSFFYALDYKTGGAVSGSYGVGGVSLGDGTATRPVLIMLGSGTVISLTRVSTGISSNTPAGASTDLGSTKTGLPTIGKSGGAGLKRVSWRELTMQ